MVSWNGCNSSRFSNQGIRRQRAFRHKRERDINGSDYPVRSFDKVPRHGITQQHVVRGAIPCGACGHAAWNDTVDPWLTGGDLRVAARIGNHPSHANKYSEHGFHKPQPAQILRSYCLSQPHPAIIHIKNEAVTLDIRQRQLLYVAVSRLAKDHVLSTPPNLRTKVYAPGDFSKCLNLPGSGKGAPWCLSPS